MNKDVNLCRLPDELSIISKFPAPLAGIMRHLPSTDSTAIQPKQPERQFTGKKNTHSKNCWYFIVHKDNSPANPVIFSSKIYLLPQSPVYRKEKEPLYEPVNYHLHLFFHRRLSQRQHTLCLLDSEDIIPERYLCIKSGWKSRHCQCLCVRRIPGWYSCAPFGAFQGLFPGRTCPADIGY